MRKQGELVGDVNLSDDDVVRYFEDAAFQDLTWKSALMAVGDENGLLDVHGHPKNRWAARIIKRGRRAHARCRRLLLEEK